MNDVLSAARKDTALKYTRISADSHIDLVWMPTDLFVKNARPGMKDRMPYVEEGPDGPRWTSKNNQSAARGRASLVGGVGSSGKKYVPGQIQRADRMAAEGMYNDASRKSHRLTDPQQRLKDQDRDGVQAEVLYGILGTIEYLGDAEAGWEVCRIYNDWLADFCKTAPNRLIGLPVIPGTDIEQALAEFKRVSKYGFKGIELGCSDNMVPLFETKWEPLWSALVDNGMAIHIHGRGQAWPSMAHWSKKEQSAANALMVSKVPFNFVPVVAAVILGGMLERHPKLNVVLGESGIGWIPALLDRMDYEWEEAFRGELELTMKPSEYWRRQCKATFQYDEVGVHLLKFLGVETLMWASDFPHPQGTWPDSADFIHKQFGHLPADVQHKIVAGNAVEFYKLT
jgi:uncharacterized protein